MAAPNYAANVAALETALGTGERTVEINGERVTYASTDDLLKALRYFEGKISSQSGRGVSRSTVVAYSGD